MRTYYLDYSTNRAAEFLGRLLPRDHGRTLYGPGGSVIARFTVSEVFVCSTPVVEYGKEQGDPYLSISTNVTANTSVWAAVDDEGLDDRTLVLRILREVRDKCGGILMDEDGNVLD